MDAVRKFQAIAMFNQVKEQIRTLGYDVDNMDDLKIIEIYNQGIKFVGDALIDYIKLNYPNS